MTGWLAPALAFALCLQPTACLRTGVATRGITSPVTRIRRVTMIDNDGQQFETVREQQEAKARSRPPSPNDERDSLYARPSFELDATTITALLGAVIAFQFFVLANM